MGLIGIMAVGTVAGQATGPQPGATDPMGSHLHLFPDDVLVSLSPDAAQGATNIRTYRMDHDTSLNLLDDNYVDTLSPVGQVGFPVNPPSAMVATAGRVFSIDPNDHKSRDAIVTARRIPGTSNIDLWAINTNGNAVIDSEHLTVSGLADRTSTNGVDAIALATGDLDQSVDASNNYHDEIVLAYPSNAGTTITLDVRNFVAYQPGQQATINQCMANITIPVSSSSVVPSDVPLSVAVGDFDNDGNKEIAVGYIGNDVRIWIYRYRFNVSNGTGSLDLVTSIVELIPTAPGFTYHPVSSLSLQAGDFDGDNADELAVGYPFSWNGATSWVRVVVYHFDNALAENGANGTTFPYFVTGPYYPRVQLAAGQLIYDPDKAPFGRKQLAVAWNDVSKQSIDISAYSISPGSLALTPIGSTVYANGDPSWAAPTAQFSLIAGGFIGNAYPSSSGSPKTPTVSLALGVWSSINSQQGVYWLQTIATSSNGLSFATQRTFATVPVDPTQRLPLVAADLDGKAVYLGAPLHLTMQDVVSTDYIIEEPPKHSFWSGDQVDTVTNYDSNHVSFTQNGQTKNSSSRTDQTNWTIGGSVEVSAGATVTGGGDAIIARATASASTDVDAKGSYEYSKNQSSLNSQYQSQSFTITSTTDHDDFINGRLKTIDLWRYRMYGIDQSASDLNTFYDVMLPGPTVPFSAGGMNFDWYQPIHENGNILTYPQKFDWSNNMANTPADMGAFKDSAGNTVTGPIVPISQWAFDGTGGTQTIDLSAGGGTGMTSDYSNTLAESTDVKASFSAQGSFLGDGGEVHASVDVSFHNSNSWGGATTSDTTTSTDTTISLSKGSQNSSQSYSFNPIVYVAQDGTYKMAFAVPNPAGSDNASGSSFWASEYGTNPDPALNLPHRFAPTYSESSGIQNGWTLNKSSSRKQLRGLFFRQATQDPVTGDYPMLNAAAKVGDQIRLEPRVYNESTALGADNITVLFQKIPYDSEKDNEICGGYAAINAGLTGGQICPAAARTLIGQATIPHLDPLQFTCLMGTDDPKFTNCAPSVFFNWDTTGSGSSSGTEEYRIYVVLVPEANSKELSGGDGVPISIAGVANATPIVITTATPHELHTGDWVTVGGTGLQLPTTDSDQNPTNSIYQISYLSPTTFSLNGTTDVAGTYSGGGTVTSLNGGENNEGYRVFDLQNTSALQGAPKQPVDDYLNKNSLRAIDSRTDVLTDSSVRANQNRALRIRVGVFSSAAHPEGSNVMLFDGDPNAGAPVIASHLIHPGNNSGSGAHVWFNWTPTTLGVHHLYAKLTEGRFDAKIGNNTAALDVDVLQRGDVNGDGQINRVDLNLIMQSVGQRAAGSSCGLDCDLDGDGKITVLDVRKLTLICGAAACGTN